VPRHDRVNRISGRARHLADDHPLLAEQAIDQRRLARIGTADDRDRHLDLLLHCHRRAARQSLDDGIEQIANAVTVLGRDLVHRIEAELIELEHATARAPIVDFVDREKCRLARLPDDFGDLMVARYEPLTAIRHEHKEIGVRDGAAAAIEHERM
jgi:hypothetical protein